VSNMLTFKQFIKEASEYRKLGKKLGVYINVERSNPVGAKNTWTLAGIERDKNSKKGAGSKVIKVLHKEADKKNKSIMLYPTGTRGRKKSKLIDYYKSLGYKPTKDGAMIRASKGNK